MAGVDIRAVHKHFGSTHVIRGVDIAIADGEFCVLVGPSGCGKSTLLRMIAGLEEISEGEIAIGGKVVNRVPPKERDIAMVFQNYALYPHMTVRDNMCFALTLAKMPKAEIEQKVAKAAGILGLEPYLDRYPRQLSGGQRQRVAMGRAIVRDPQVFLFDEPLSNLDAKLRVQMRTEIKELHQRLKTTSIYVTHDQIEAMTMADKIVVMRDGIVEQIGRSARALRSAGEYVRRGLHRLAGDEHDPRRRAGRRRGSSSATRPRCRCRLARAPRTAARCSTAFARSTARSATRGLPVDVVVVEPTGADTQLYCRFNGQERHRDDSRPRRLQPWRPDPSRARSGAGARVRRGERHDGSSRETSTGTTTDRRPPPKEEVMSDIQASQVPAIDGRRRGQLRARRRQCTLRAGGRGADNTRSRRRRAPPCACCAGSASCRATRTSGRPTRRSSPR